MMDAAAASVPFHMHGENDLTLSDLRGPQQPFRSGRKRLGGRIRGKGGGGG